MEAKQSSLLTDERMGGMMKERAYCATDAVVPVFAAFIDENPGFMKKSDLILMTVVYTEMENRVLFDHGDKAQVQDALGRLRPETRKFKSVVGNAFVPHHKFGFLTLQALILDLLVEDLGRIGSLSSTDAGPSENFDVLIKHSCRMESQRRSTRMNKTVYGTTSAPDKVQKPESEIQRDVLGASVLWKGKYVEGSRGTCV